MTTLFLPEVALFSLGGIVFTAASAHDETLIADTDEFGVGWGLDIQQGWWDTPDVRAQSNPLPLRDGARVGDAYRSGRTLSLRGGIVHADVGVTQAAIQRLLGALDILRTDGLLIGYEALGAKQLTVRRAAPVDITWVTPCAEWSTTLVAADWRKYDIASSEALLSSYVAATSGIDMDVDTGPDSDLGDDFDAGSGADQGVDFSGVTGASPDAECTNAGTADTFPYIEFRGPSSGSMTSFRLTNLTTGQILKIDTTVNTGETLIADMPAAYGITTGSPVTLGGVSRYGGWNSPRTPFFLQPGVNVLRFEVLAGTATGAIARVVWRSAWE